MTAPGPHGREPPLFMIVGAVSRSFPLALLALALVVPMTWAQDADLEVSTSGPAQVAAGRDVTFTVTATNHGPRVATNVSVTDTVVAPLTFVSATQTAGPSFTCTTPAVGATGPIACGIATLRVREAATFAVLLRVAPSAPNESRVSNEATIVASSPDPNPANNTATGTAGVASHADVGVTLTGPPGVAAGANATYTITVTNVGPAEAGVYLTSVMPPGSGFISATQTTGPPFGCTTPAPGTTGSISCSIPVLPVGASATFSLVLNVPTTATGAIASTADVSTTTSDPVPGNNSVRVSTPVTPGPADVGVTQTVGPVVAGTVTYTIVVTNHGPAVASNVVMTDVLPAGSMLSSATSTQGSCTATSTVTCTLGVLSPGVSATTALVIAPPNRRAPEANTATVAARNDDPDPTNNSSTARGAATRSPLWSSIFLVLGIALAATGFFVLLQRHPAAVGRALFLLGVFLMVTGDWPQSTLLPSRGTVPMQCLGWAWEWLYLAVLGGSFVVLMSMGALRMMRPTTADFLYPAIGLLTATFLLSVVFSQVPPLSWWAFGCFLAIAGFALTLARVADDETFLTGVSIVMAAAASFLAVRVLAWRFDEGLTTFPYHVRNTAWLGKNQISWVLNLLAPLLLCRFLSAQSIPATLLFGGAWLLTGAAIYVVFSSTGIAALALTTLVLGALNARYWRRWSILLIGLLGLSLGLVAAVSTGPSIRLVASLLQPYRDTAIVMRWGLWRETLHMVADRPIVGMGLGTYDDVSYTQYPTGTATDPWFFRRGWHAHNTHLHLLAETGALGFLAWCFFWFAIVRFLLRRWRQGDTLGRLNSSAVLCFILAFFILSMTDAIIMARVHASLRMNLTLALLLIYGIRLVASAPSTLPASLTAPS